MGYSRIITRALQLICLVLISLGSVGAASLPELPSHAKPMEGVLVPVPKEIFRTLDQFQNVNWRAVQRPQMVHWKSRGDPVQISLLLGVVVAEGFIAMEAQDAKEVTDVANRVLVLARGLGVEQTALRRSRSIIDQVEANQWNAARKEWDSVLSDLEQGMIALKSEPLFHVVSLGGWLRGSEALSVLIMQDYSKHRANLLAQSTMLEYLEKQLLAMPGPARSHPMVAKMLQGLRKYRSLLEGNRDTVSEKTVEEIANTCRGLVVAISQRGE